MMASFRDVIVGVDGREGGRDAIALGRLLVAPTGRLTLAHVREGGLAPPSADDVAFEAEIDAAPVAESQKLLEREREAAGVAAELIDVVDRHVGPGLHKLAERERADLLVVGSCHRARWSRLLVGDDTRASLDGATCAVAVAPLGYGRDAGGMTRIGVGYNGSPESKNALALARGLASAPGATVRALRIAQVPGPPFSPTGRSPVDTDVYEKEMAALDGVKGEVRFGFEDEELAALSGEVDLLIVGSRSYGPLARLMLGSTARYLAAHARCPLIVLPRAAGSNADPADE